MTRRIWNWCELNISLISAKLSPSVPFLISQPSTTLTSPLVAGASCTVRGVACLAPTKWKCSVNHLLHVLMSMTTKSTSVCLLVYVHTTFCKVQTPLLNVFLSAPHSTDMWEVFRILHPLIGGVDKKNVRGKLAAVCCCQKITISLLGHGENPHKPNFNTHDATVFLSSFCLMRRIPKAF